MSKHVFLSLCGRVAHFAGAPFLLSLAFSPNIYSRHLSPSSSNPESDAARVRQTANSVVIRKPIPTRTRVLLKDYLPEAAD